MNLFKRSVFILGFLQDFMGNEYERSPEVKARHEKINPKLGAAGWDIQDYNTANVQSSKGVAVEYFQIGKDQADYILFVNGVAV